MGNKGSSSKRNSLSNSQPASPVKRESVVSTPDSTTSSGRGMLRSPSGADLKDKSTTKFTPIEELAKLLAKKNENEGSRVNGITDHVFTKYVFPQHPDLGMRIFSHFHYLSRAKTQHLGVTAFKQQCDRFMAVLDDAKIVEMYVIIFCNHGENATREGIRSLLKISFDIAMAHYVGDGKGCAKIQDTLDAVLATIFFSDSPFSTGFIAKWIEENCTRIILPVHKYTIHLLTTAYRCIKLNQADLSTNGMELATPILDKKSPFEESLPMLTVSIAWFLAGVLPPIFSVPRHVPTTEKTLAETDVDLRELASSSANLPSHNLLAKISSTVPSHWTLLYDTKEHGVGANRFLHHVLGYRGPTIILLNARSYKDNSEKLYCIGSPTEWKETTLYTGGEDSCLVQVLPKFSIMEKGMKILYLNTHIRGYPKGLRVAVDPRNPIIAVDEQFEKVDVHSISHSLLDIEVWGCGNTQARDVQLDIKKWQVKEAERQRTVKLTSADWIDHPDRYLLELGGRPQYNNSNN